MPRRPEKRLFPSHLVIPIDIPNPALAVRNPIPFTRTRLQASFDEQIPPFGRNDKL
jgi:hypothetical protein